MNAMLRDLGSVGMGIEWNPVSIRIDRGTAVDDHGVRRLARVGWHVKVRDEVPLGEASLAAPVGAQVTPPVHDVVHDVDHGVSVSVDHGVVTHGLRVDVVVQRRVASGTRNVDVRGAGADETPLHGNVTCRLHDLQIRYLRA